MNKLFFITIIISFFISDYAQAYVGIGPLIPLIGNAVVFIFLAAVGIMGFVLYPVRKIYSYVKKKKQNKLEENSGNTGSQQDSSETEAEFTDE